MILIAGGSGQLGTRVVKLLTTRGLSVRVLTRDPKRARALRGDLVELVKGDVRDRPAVDAAMSGISTVISAVQGFSGAGDCNPQTIDRDGNRNLIAAAQSSGVEHLILLSVHGAAADHPMELFRMKYAAEQDLRASRLAWTIIRPTAYMETWAMLIGEPLIETGKTRLFGRCRNPINFVSAADVARFVELAVVDPNLRGSEVEVGGPENLTMRQFERSFEAGIGKEGTVSQIPLPMMRLMSMLIRPVNPTLARQIQAGVVMDTRDMSFDPAETSQRYPSIEPITLAAMIQRDYAGKTASRQPVGPVANADRAIR
jgi:uncharacterized protein YbjT (DUF2867 family)